MKNDGGPAFPKGYSANQNNGEMDWPERGMSLRDYFAAAYLQGWVANGDLSSRTPDSIAKAAYVMADAMIAERER